MNFETQEHTTHRKQQFKNLSLIALTILKIKINSIRVIETDGWRVSE